MSNQQTREEARVPRRTEFRAMVAGRAACFCNACYAERHMPVDNELYDRLSDTWWDEGTVLGSMCGFRRN